MVITNVAPQYDWVSCTHLSKLTLVCFENYLYHVYVLACSRSFLWFVPNYNFGIFLYKVEQLFYFNFLFFYFFIFLLLFLIYAVYS